MFKFTFFEKPQPQSDIPPDPRLEKIESEEASLNAFTEKWTGTVRPLVEQAFARFPDSIEHNVEVILYYAWKEIKKPWPDEVPQTKISTTQEDEATVLALAREKILKLQGINPDVDTDLPEQLAA